MHGCFLDVVVARLFAQLRKEAREQLGSWRKLEEEITAACVPWAAFGQSWSKLVKVKLRVITKY